MKFFFFMKHSLTHAPVIFFLQFLSTLLQIYAVTIWALIWSTIFAPVAFKWALQIYSSQKVMVRSHSIGGMKSEHTNQPFKIRLVSEHHVGILCEFFAVDLC
jgi:hypothetical protein